MTYTKDQVFDATKIYFCGNELATSVWISKYALKDSDGNFLEKTPDDMHARMATEFARIEHEFPSKKHKDKSAYGNSRTPLTKDDIYNLFAQFRDIIPQGSIMAVLGDTTYTGSLSNCVVISSPYDSYGGISFTDEQLAQLMKRRCGVGFDISSLRPKDSNVSNVAKKSTGAVSFMHRFSATTREVAQGGRRGALMITMNCAHPDILDFITSKQDLTKITGANISVMWTDEFMSALERDDNFTLRFPVDKTPEEADVTKVVRAKDIWDTAITSAYKSGEPGMIFIDRMRQYSVCDPYDKIVSTNPCSEIGMGANDSCRLIASNMFGSVVNPYTENASFDFDKWYRICYEAQVLSDDLVELELEVVEKILAKLEHDPEPDYIKKVEQITWERLYESGVNGRRTGCGFTALADTLAALGTTYNDTTFIDQIIRTKFMAEWDATTDLAIDRGTFPLYEKYNLLDTEFTMFLQQNHPSAYDRMLKHGRRNISISTVAPTGSLSMLAKLNTRFGTTSGIEPLFAPWYTRRKKVNPNEDNAKIDFVDEVGDSWTEYHVFHNGLMEWALANNISESQIIEKYDQSPYYLSCANDIHWRDRVTVQSAVQWYTTHSISSTVNLPKTTLKENVDLIYQEAYRQGLKGITVYVDGSRDGVLIAKPTVPKIAKNNAPKRPKSLPCTVFNTSIKGQYWVVLIGFLNDDPYEIFAFPNGKVTYKTGNIIKRGKGIYDLEVNGRIVIENIPVLYESDEQESLTRMISTALRHGSAAKYIIEQLDKSNGTIISFSKAIARALKHTLQDGDVVKVTCKECGSTNVVFQEGCY